MKEFSEKDFLLLAYLEGDLTEAEKIKFEAMMAKDATLMQEYKLLSKTILPVEEIVYTPKANLKKPVTAQKVALGYLFWSGAVAACLAVLIILYSPKAANTEVVINEADRPSKTEKELETTSTAKSFAIEKDDELNDVKIEPKLAVQNQAPKTITPSPKNDSKIQNVVLFEKENLVVITLETKPSVFPAIELPNSDVSFDTTLERPIKPIFYNSNKDTKGWLARKTNKINNTLNSWIIYLQKPKIEISKKKPANNGRIYWAITLEADEYEWEGRLYSSLF